ncbi:YhdP family protein [Thioalkalivibrio sp. ALJT]|uniref:YhdP family protein n=1 Tax=Thioalkalivibrio sp. ALJT TaxID=1158146 RepID=UPI0003624F01|nr:YhdP family protein [Thioalkalivibrio sp. ALJT]
MSRSSPILRGLAWIGLGLVLLLVILLLALRLALPHWDGIQAWVEDSASEQLGHVVTTARVELGWSGWSPALVARDVVMDMDPGEAVVTDSLGVSLNVGASLRSLHPVLDVRVRGLELRLVRAADDRFFLNGRELGTDEGRWLSRAHWLDVQAEHLQLSWEDRVAERESALRLDRAALRTARDGSLRLHLSGVPDGAGPGAAVALGVEAPAADLRAARFFLQAAEIDLEAVQPWLAYLGWTAPAGSTSLRLWGGLADGRVGWLRGEHDTTLRLDGEPVATAIGHRFAWQVTDARHRSSWSGTHPGSGDLRLAYRLEGDAGALVVDAVELAARDLEVEPYAPLLTLLEQAAPELAGKVAALRPRGHLEQARLHAQREDARLLPVWAEADVRDLEWQAVGAAPGVRGATGYMQWRRGGVELLLDGREMRLDLPQVLAGPVDLDRARGRLRAERDPQGHWYLAGEGLYAANAHAAARGRMRMLLDEHAAGPRVDLALDILRADAAYTARYLPASHLPEATDTWLRNSIQSGRVTGGGMVYRGRGRDFPFAQDEGVFDLWAEVEDGVLDYQADWPRVEDLSGRLQFRNAGFRALGARGRILDTEVRDADIRIADMEQAVLELTGRSEGDTADLLTYLQRAELLEEAAEIRDRAQVAGPARLDLALKLPLQAGRMDATRVSGELDLDGVRFQVPGWPAELEAVTGVVAFDTAERIRAEAVAARVHDEAVTLDADWPLDGEEVRLRARGAQPLEPWLEVFPEVAPYLSGRAHWDARLRLGPRVDGVRLDLASDLEGVAIDGPEPLGKSADAARDLELTLPLGHSGPGVGRLRLGEVLRAHMRLSPAQAPEDPAVRGAEPRVAARGLGLQALALEIGAPKATPLSLPGSGVSVRVRLPRVDVEPWRTVLGELPWDGAVAQGAPGEASASATHAVLLERVDLHVSEQIRWGGRTLPGLRVLARRGDLGWDLEVVSDWLAGEGRWRPADGDGRGHLEADLRHLTLEDIGRDNTMAVDTVAVEPVATGTLEDPRAWPAIDLTLDSLALDDYRFGDVVLGLAPRANGLVVRDFALRAPEGDLRADAVGAWQVDADGRPEARLDVELAGTDWGSGMRSSRLSRALLGSSGEGMLSLAWEGPLYGPRLAQLTGSMEVVLSDGRLADVEPGAGRVLGLVSLDVLPRRLRLDFRDVFTEGLSFSELTADAALRDGNLYVPALRMDGPSARVRLSGRTGLVVRDYDHEFVVVPSIRTALPLVGALVGGPVTGVVVLLAERMLGIGDQMEEAARVEYSVTGSWDDPQVRMLVEPAAETGGNDND